MALVPSAPDAIDRLERHLRSLPIISILSSDLASEIESAVALAGGNTKRVARLRAWAANALMRANAPSRAVAMARQAELAVRAGK